MIIKSIKASNFKSYDKIDIKLDKLNFIIGGNASGKSNYVNLLKFFNDIIIYGIDDAILLQGGIKYLFNSNKSRDEEFKFEIEVDLEQEKNASSIMAINKNVWCPSSFIYNLTLQINKKGEGYKLLNERIELDFDKLNSKSSKKNYSLIIEKDKNGKVKDNIIESIEDKDEMMTINIIHKFARMRGDILTNIFSAISLFYGRKNKIKIYNFDVNLIKSPSSIAGRNELEENGSNVVNIIHQLLKDKNDKKVFKKIIKSILPFVDDINIENSMNKSVYFKVKENYNKNEFPSYMLSDGTVNILAVIIALYFQEDNEIIVLEEPEKNIHPKLLGKLVALLLDVSKNKQIFVTTHNPYIVKEADLENILLVSRNRNGISHIGKTLDNKRIVTFLENELGIEDLFVDGIL